MGADDFKLTEDSVELRHRERVAAELVHAGFDPEDTEKLWDIDGAVERISQSLHNDWILFVENRDGILGRRLRREARQARKESDDTADAAG